MVVKDILIWPDPILAQKSLPVKCIDKNIKSLVDNMFAIMYKANGMGLAAPQIGVFQQVVVIDISLKESNNKAVTGDPIVLINPIITKREGSDVAEEACLSIPGFWGDVKRSTSVELKYLDLHGKEQIIHCEDFFARCVQHEIDHLNGTVWVDHVSKLKRNMIKKKMIKLKSRI